MVGVKIARTALAAWIVATLIIGVGATALHEIPLPLPAPRDLAPADRFRLVHALSASCPCSQRVLGYLERRGASPEVTETILLVDGDPQQAAALRARGFEVILLDEASLARDHGIVAAPSLVVFRPDGTSAYRGAYAPRPQMEPIDLELLARARAGADLEAMPILGCAVSRGLRDRLDPLRLKYRR